VPDSESSGIHIDIYYDVVPKFYRNLGGVVLQNVEGQETGPQGRHEED
jgi:hypothetical protein